MGACRSLSFPVRPERKLIKKDKRFQQLAQIARTHKACDRPSVSTAGAMGDGAWLDRDDAAHGMPASLEHLQEHYCVCAAHPGGSGAWRLLGPDARVHEVQIASRFNANTAQALRKATLAGMGIALLPATLIRADLRSGLLVPVLPHYQRTSHGLHVLYPSRQHLPLAVSAFIDLVMEKLRVRAFPAQ